MSGLDAGFFFADDENNPLHIASVTLFEGPAPTYGDVVRKVIGKLPEIPRYRQRVRTVPFNLGRPVWVDDPHFQILYHVRHTALPPPGGPDELRNLAGRVLSQRLDPAKPLWEIWLVEGIEDGRWAAIAKVHHCMIDGVGGIDLMTAMFDLTPEGDRVPTVGGTDPPSPSDPPGPSDPADPADPHDPAGLTGPSGRPARSVRSEPSAISLLITGLRDMVADPVRQLPAVPALLRGLTEQRTAAAGFTLGLPRAVGRLAMPVATSLNGPIGPHRRWTWTHADLAEVRRIRLALGGTVNDVILAAVTRGFRELLHERGELTPHTLVRTLVPVSVRDDDHTGEFTNLVSGVLINLPCGEDDPRRRLFLIRRQMSDVKNSHQAVSGDAIARVAGFAPTLLALGSRAALRHSQPLVQTVVTNVPGPPAPLYVLGRRLIELYPYVPLAMGLRVGVAIFSYLDALTFGITGDFDAMPDLDVLTSGIRAGFDELAKIAAEKE